MFTEKSYRCNGPCYVIDRYANGILHCATNSLGIYVQSYGNISWHYFDGVLNGCGSFRAWRRSDIDQFSSRFSAHRCTRSCPWRYSTGEQYKPRGLFVPFNCMAVIAVILCRFAPGSSTFWHPGHNITTAYIPVFIGVYILLKLWSERMGRLLSSFDSLFVLGFFQTGLGILVGSTGHLVMPRLLKEIPDRDGIVATSGMFMALSHGLKLLAYGIIGFTFSQYSALLVYMVIGALIGSLLGTLLRRKISNRWFSQVLKVLLTVMALRMIYSALA